MISYNIMGLVAMMMWQIGIGYKICQIQKNSKSMNFTMIGNIHDIQKCQILLSCKGETNYCT
jgi:hypothetical protein